MIFISCVYILIFILQPEINIFHQQLLKRMSNFKKKKEQPPKGEKKTLKANRVDTEAAQPLKIQLSKQKNAKKPTQVERAQKTYKIERCVTNGPANESAATVFKTPKTTLSIKQLVKTMSQLKYFLESEYDELLSGKIDQNRYKQISQILNSNYFRFRNTTFTTALDQFANVIQALELLMSKLTNNQKLTEKVFIRDEEDFVLFFKFFFAKPYTLINLPAVRKVVKLLWDQSLFPSLTIPAILNNLRLWIFGISSPLNPSMNKLHKLCTEYSDQISKLVTHKSNMYVYVGVNDSDTLCLTPLMVALIAGNIRGVQKLIKNGADLRICPLTVNSKILLESIETYRPSGRVVIKKQFGVKERKQADPIEYLKYKKKNDQIAHMLCWQNFYQLKKLRKNHQMIDLLQVFPNCCFQIDWKEFRGILCFKDLPQDIISVYKKDNCLRIDYHVNSLEASKKKGHFSLIFKALGKQDNKFFLIDHNEKTIRNILEDKDIKSIKQKFNTILKHGNVYKLDISDLKAVYIPKQSKLTLCVQNYYQNYTKPPHFPTFESQNDYFKTVVESEMINYSELQKNQIKAILNQNIVKIDKEKAKIFKSQSNLDIEWVQQQLNLKHLTLLLKLSLVAVPQSTFFHKIQSILKLFQDPAIRQLKLLNKLPLRSKLITGQDANIQCQIKNIRYCKLQDSIFKLQIRAREMNFQQLDQPVDLSHLQDTVYLQQMYSIRASRFVGNSEKMLEIQDQEANKKFQELLRLQGIWSNDQEEEK